MTTDRGRKPSSPATVLENRTDLTTKNPLPGNLPATADLHEFWENPGSGSLLPPQHPAGLKTYITQHGINVNVASNLSRLKAFLQRAPAGRCRSVLQRLAKPSDEEPLHHHSPSKGASHIEELLQQIPADSDRYQVLQSARSFKSSWAELVEWLTRAATNGKFRDLTAPRQPPAERDQEQLNAALAPLAELQEVYRETLGSLVQTLAERAGT